MLVPFEQANGVERLGRTEPGCDLTKVTFVPEDVAAEEIT